jgi:phospholipid/cholesterol/gamma-HCH transport system permease protein
MLSEMPFTVAMMNATPSEAHVVIDSTRNCYACTGDWSAPYLTELVNILYAQSLPNAQNPLFSGQGITHLDSAGALALLDCLALLKKTQPTIQRVDFSDQHEQLIQLVEAEYAKLTPKKPKPKAFHFLSYLGKHTVHKIEQITGFITLLGNLSDKLFRACFDWRRLRLPSIVHHLFTTGIQALPILALLSFLIGIVLVYQMGIQLENYGANSFIAYVSGMAIFREFAPLITAIIVAGRTSSAFTAQIGSMKVNEELDALHTMGLSPTALIVVPKVIALVLIFPLIIFWSDIFSLLGAMIMAKSMLGVAYGEFLLRIQDTVGCKQLMLGLYKAPAFALVTALVGCFQGFQVESSADSVGSQTTRSVVQALFLIIVVDSVYSIIYSWMDI